MKRNAMPPPTVPLAGPRPTAPRWEYTTAVVKQTLFTGKQKQGAADHVLAQHGAQGWELTGVIPDVNIKGARDGIMLFFKRPA